MLYAKTIGTTIMLLTSEYIITFERDRMVTTVKRGMTNPPGPWRRVYIHSLLTTKIPRKLTGKTPFTEYVKYVDSQTFVDQQDLTGNTYTEMKKLLEVMQPLLQITTQNYLQQIHLEYVE